MDAHSIVAPARDPDIDRDRLAFEDALRAGDAAAAAATYAEDATLLAPAAGPVHGRPAIERFWRFGVDAGMHDVRLAVLDLQRTGDVAVEIGEYVLHLAPEVGGTIVDRGRYLTVLRFGPDGRWLRTAEMFSPDDAPVRDRQPGAAP